MLQVARVPEMSVGHVPGPFATLAGPPAAGYPTRDRDEHVGGGGRTRASAATSTNASGARMRSLNLAQREARGQPVEPTAGW
jgi:hypothetical protein